MMKSQSNWGRVDKVDYEPEKSLFKAFLHIGSQRMCSSVTDHTANLCKTICDSRRQNAEANVVENDSKKHAYAFQSLKPSSCPPLDSYIYRVSDNPMISITK